MEDKWFGGKLGGHVGVEFRDGQILNFLPSGEFHYIAHKNDKNSKFAIHSVDGFYSMFGTHQDSVKKLIVHIPISAEQKATLDSLAMAYMQEVPYDYAFLGMRCGSAAYDVLDEIDIVKNRGYRATILKIFYPKKLRKRLIKKVKENDWKFERQRGTIRRKWERD